MSAISIDEIKGTKNGKIFNFFKGRFSVMGGPMDMILAVFSETKAKLLKSIILLFFSKYSKSYNNLKVKSCLKLHGP